MRNKTAAVGIGLLIVVLGAGSWAISHRGGGSNAEKSPDFSIADFQAFASSLTKQMEISLQPSNDLNASAPCALLNTDIIKTNSVVHPVVAMAKIKWRYSAKSGIYLDQEFSLSFDRDGRRWKLIQATTRRTGSMGMPESGTAAAESDVTDDPRIISAVAKAQTQ